MKFSLTLAIDNQYWKAKSKFQWEATVMFFLGASVRLVAAISVAKCYNDESELRSFKRNGRLLANDIGYSKKKKMQVLPAGVEPPLTYMKLLWDRSCYKVKMGETFCIQNQFGISVRKRFLVSYWANRWSLLCSNMRRWPQCLNSSRSLTRYGDSCNSRA